MCLAAFYTQSYTFTCVMVVISAQFDSSFDRPSTAFFFVNLKSTAVWAGVAFHHRLPPPPPPPSSLLSSSRSWCCLAHLLNVGHSRWLCRMFLLLIRCCWFDNSPSHQRCWRRSRPHRPRRWRQRQRRGFLTFRYRMPNFCTPVRITRRRVMGDGGDYRFVITFVLSCFIQSN